MFWGIIVRRQFCNILCVCVGRFVPLQIYFGQQQNDARNPIDRNYWDREEYLHLGLIHIIGAMTELKWSRK